MVKVFLLMQLVFVTWNVKSYLKEKKKSLIRHFLRKFTIFSVTVIAVFKKVN